jgi:hypothetical protein
MKASDFRIGNLINHEKFGICQVITIYQNTYDASLDGERKLCFATKETQPIPLTEEWLLKFGFEFINYHTDIDEENPDFIYNEYRKKLEGVGYTYDIVSSPYAVYQFQIDFKWCEKGVAADLKYVHQLQNLYHALTGEELTHGK